MCRTLVTFLESEGFSWHVWRFPPRHQQSNLRQIDSDDFEREHGCITQYDAVFAQFATEKHCMTEGNCKSHGH